MFPDRIADLDGLQGKPAITVTLQKTLKMTDDVLSVRCSPDGRFIAVSLLDSTVKIFHADTLKFFLSLYGHKLPVLSMDISSDSKLIVTCSADKNVKIWGLDFGDCHKSIFAHEESVMQVLFEKGSHCFWTVGKDKLVKYWDGDRVSPSLGGWGRYKLILVCASSRTSRSLMDIMVKFGLWLFRVGATLLLRVRMTSRYGFGRSWMNRSVLAMPVSAYH